MHKHILLLIFICFCFIGAHSQNNWETGYIITSQNDTIYGFIDNRDTKSNSKQCFFKISKENQQQDLTPNDIKAYRFINGKYYIAKTIENFNNNQPVFLEYIVHSSIDFYHYRDNKNYYYIEKDGKLYELKNTESIIKNESGTTYLKEGREYLGVLGVLLQDANMNKEIQTYSLDNKSLISIAQKYEDRVCSGQECIIYERTPNKKHASFQVFLGGRIQSVNFGGVIKSNIVFTDHMGFQFEFENIVEWAEKFTFQIGLSHTSLNNLTISPADHDSYATIYYKSERFLVSNTESILSYYRSELDVNLKTHFIRVPLSINYYFRKGNTPIYAGVGFLPSFTISQNKDFIYNAFNEEYEHSIPFFNYGFQVKVGCKFKIDDTYKIFIESSYEISKSININQMLRLNQNAGNLSVGYIF